jgi:hypothetical protein
MVILPQGNRKVPRNNRWYVPHEGIDSVSGKNQFFRLWSSGGSRTAPSTDAYTINYLLMLPRKIVLSLTLQGDPIGRPYGLCVTSVIKLCSAFDEGFNIFPSLWHGYSFINL